MKRSRGEKRENEVERLEKRTREVLLGERSKASRK